jgi:ceroid-lipofuscinosis MFS transporter 7
MTAIQYAGFTVSPIIGSILVKLGQMINIYWSFALPCGSISTMAILSSLGLLYFFEDSPDPNSSSKLKKSPRGYENVDEKDTSFRHPSFSENVSRNQVTPVLSKEYLTFCSLSMILLYVCANGSISVYETLGAQIAKTDYGMSELQLGTLVTISGIFGFIQLLLFNRLWTRYFTDLQIIQGSLVVMITAQLIAISHARKPNVYRFIIGFVLMYAIGYPIGYTAILGTFSKIQKSGPQGAVMSWLVTAGSISRIVFPIITGYIDRAVDNSPFCITLAILSLSLGCVVWLRPAFQELIEDQIDPKFDGRISNTWRCLSAKERFSFFATVGLFFFSISSYIWLAVY